MKKSTKKKSTKTKKSSKPTKVPEIPLPILRVLVEMYYDFQNTRIRTSNRSAMNLERNGLEKGELKTYGVDMLFDASKKFEKDIEARIKQDLTNRPIYTEYLSKIKGIGPVLAGGLIAWLRDPSNYQSVSQLWQNTGLGMNKYCTDCNEWAYIDIEIDKTNREGKVTKTKAKRFTGKAKVCTSCGSSEHLVSQAQIKASGKQINWNPKLKTLLWKIGGSFVKNKASKSWYRAIYDYERAKLDAKYPKAEKIDVRGTKRLQHNPKHNFEAAKRKVEKLFLQHLWLVWRAMEGHELRTPYMPKGEESNHKIIPPLIDDDELPNNVQTALKELNKSHSIYPKNMIPDWVPRVDKTKAEDAEDQAMNDEEESE